MGCHALVGNTATRAGVDISDAAFLPFPWNLLDTEDALPSVHTQKVKADNPYNVDDDK